MNYAVCYRRVREFNYHYIDISAQSFKSRVKLMSQLRFSFVIKGVRHKSPNEYEITMWITINRSYQLGRFVTEFFAQFDFPSGLNSCSWYMYHLNSTRDATQYKYITRFKWVIEPVIFFSTYSLSIYLIRFFSLYIDLITNVYFSFPRSCHIISKTYYFNNNFYEYLFTNTQIMNKTSLPMYGQHGVVHLLLSMLWQWYIWRRSCTTERNPSCQIRHNARWWGIEKCFLLPF